MNTSAIFSRPGRLERLFCESTRVGAGKGSTLAAIRQVFGGSRTHDENHLKEQLQRRTRCALI